MEFVKGRELADILEGGERYDTSGTVLIAEQMLSALAYCHSQGVVHRDLKPANLLMLEDGTVKLTDFGIARVESSTLTRVGAVMGTPNYMSPEQLTGQSTDARSDLFAAGVILYELLTGEKPFPGKSMPLIMARVMRAEFEPPSSVNVHLNPSWDRLIRRSLGKRPVDRFQSADDFLAALRLAVDDRYQDDELDEEEPETLMAGSDDAATVIRPRRAAGSSTGLRGAGAGGDSKATYMAGLESASVGRQARPDAEPRGGSRRRGLLISASVAAMLLLAAVGLWQTGQLDGLLAGVDSQTSVPSSGVPPSLGDAWRPARSEEPAPDAGSAGTGVTESADLAPAAETTPDSSLVSGVVVPAGGVDVQTETREGNYYALLSASTEPEGATVLIDEVEFGKTPLEMDMPPGIYQVRLQKAGFDDIQTEVSVDPATAVRLRGRFLAK